jgi:hypothetical protein
MAKKSKVLKIALKKVFPASYGTCQIGMFCRQDEYLAILKYFAIKPPVDYRTIEARARIQAGNQRQSWYYLILPKKKYDAFFNK